MNAIELRKITKVFGNVVANQDVDLDVKCGEILAILGENGSGKTTLMNMIAGIYYPDSGEIYINGEQVFIRSPKDSFRYKIGMIHQHFKLIDIFSSTENIVLGNTEGKFNLKSAKARVKEISARYGFDIDPDKKIYDMSVSEKQTVEIMKVLYRGADILILDEPTAVLTPQEAQKLFAVLRRMREDGKAIIIITHKLHEVLSLSDRVAILRKGKHIATVETAKTNESELTEMMVGERVSLNIRRDPPHDPQDRLVVTGLSCLDREGVRLLDDITFTARSGEILGIAGIAGSGQRELLEAIAGLHDYDRGTVIYHNPKKDKPVTFFHKSISQVIDLAAKGAFHDEKGDPVSFSGMTRAQIKAKVNEGGVLFYEDEIVDLKDKTPLQIRELGVRFSFVPEDRLGMGLVGNMDIVDNMLLRSYRKGHSVFLSKENPAKLAERIISDLNVITPNTHTPVRRLSGGNVQKVLVGREIAFAPRVLMAAYPVRGLDVNSSYTIYNLLNEQKNNGVAVIFVGEDLDVLLELCDRIMVLGGGRVTGIVDAATTTKEQIGLLMTKTEGGKENG